MLLLYLQSAHEQYFFLNLWMGHKLASCSIGSRLIIVSAEEILSGLIASIELSCSYFQFYWAAHYETNGNLPSICDTYVDHFKSGSWDRQWSFVAPWSYQLGCLPAFTHTCLCLCFLCISYQASHLCTFFEPYFLLTFFILNNKNNFIW